MALLARRALLAGSLLAAPALSSARAAGGALRRGLADLERTHGGRLGVAVLGGPSAGPIAYRGDERFALCSTYKFLAAAFVLARVDRREESLGRRIVFSRDRLVPYSPITGKHVGGSGLTVGDICDAAVTLSDNTAGNLLLDSFGGPAALTAYMRSLGDRATRLDRREPALNEASPGDPRDTTTPMAMLGTIRKTVLGTALSAPSRAQLAAWLVGCRTGNGLLRSGIPRGWRVGDKTGAGDHGARNDIAIIWPPAHAPLIVTTFYAESAASADEQDAVLSEVGQLASAT